MSQNRRLFQILLLACGVCLSSVVAFAEEPAAEGEAKPEKVSYYNQIRPIFQDNCQGCHQPAKPEGGFVMTTVETMQKGGDSEEPAFEPGDPDASFLISQIEPLGDEKPPMPKDAEPLKKEQIELIRQWILEGCVDDTPESAIAKYTMDNPPVYDNPPVITSVDYSPDGSLLAVSGYHEVLLHEADGSELVARLVGMSERVQDLKFSPDGKRLAAVGGSPARFGEVQVWDVESRELKLSLPVTYDTIYGVSWSNDGKMIAFGCADNSIRAIDAETGKQVLFQGAHSDWALGTIFSNDDSHLISVGRDRTAKLTEVKTQRFVDNITSITPGALKGGLLAIDVHPSKDEILVGGADGAPKIFIIHRTEARRIGDNANLVREFEALPGRVFAVAYDPEGNRIAAGSSNSGDGEVRIYQESDGKLLTKISENLGPVYTVAWHPDGKVLAVAGFDGVVRQYDAESGKLIKEFSPAPIADAVARAQ